MKFIGFFLKVALLVSGFNNVLWAQSHLNARQVGELQVGQRVLVASAQQSGFTAGNITRIQGPFHAYFDYQVFTQNMNYFREVLLQKSSIIPSVKELEGYQAKQIVCLKENAPYGLGGRDVEINAVFANRMAEVLVGDFFGKRFLFFKRPEIVSLDVLTGCDGQN